MQYIDEYRNPQTTLNYAKAIQRITTQPWNIMEICGGQTHAIMKYDLDGLLPESVSLIHGPGCPVCVTPIERIEQAIAIARKPQVIFCSFGDMLRVPGAQANLLAVKAEGGDVRIVYSPLDAVKIAREQPDRQVVFFAIGFESTAPANALAVYQAYKQKLKNFSVLVSHVLVPPAISTILSSPGNCVQGILAAGHVCAVMGYHEYLPIADRYSVPIVVTGFEPVDIMYGIFRCVQQLEAERTEVENAYPRAVSQVGNVQAQDFIREIFTVADQKWRGIGEIPKSGLVLRGRYEKFDAAKRFSVSKISAEESSTCICGLVLQGKEKPPACPEFGQRCTPEHPLGATMVSDEGACAAYYHYRRPSAAAAATAGNQP